MVQVRLVIARGGWRWKTQVKVTGTQAATGFSSRIQNPISPHRSRTRLPKQSAATVRCQRHAPGIFDAIKLDTFTHVWRDLTPAAFTLEMQSLHVEVHLAKQRLLATRDQAADMSEMLDCRFRLNIQ